MGPGTQLMFMLVVILLIPVFLIGMNRMRTRGKCVCFMLLGTLPLSPKLLKVGKDGFVEFEGKKFQIQEEMIRLIQWPLGMPTILTEMVPAALYDIDTAEQLDWRSLNIEGGHSSTEIGAVLDPQWLAIFIKGMKDAGGLGGSRFERMVPLLTMALAGLALVMVFVVMVKLGTLQSAINRLGG